MIIYEILHIHREFFKRIAAMGVTMSDIKYIDLYREYLKMRDNGDKVTYIVAELSERYAISERKVYDLLNKFATPCKNIAP